MYTEINGAYADGICTVWSLPVPLEGQNPFLSLNLWDTSLIRHVLLMGKMLHQAVLLHLSCTWFLFIQLEKSVDIHRLDFPV